MATIHDIVIENKTRYYKCDLTKQDFSMEFTTPYKLVLPWTTIIEGKAWGDFLTATARKLLEHYPDKEPQAFNMRASWSNKITIFKDSQMTNSKEVKPGVFINVNHTAVHSCWLLQELLEFFGEDLSKVEFLVYRPSQAEPQDAKEFYRKKFDELFADYWTHKGMSTENITKVLSIIDRYLNPELKKVSDSYTDIKLFQNCMYSHSYTKRIRENLNANTKLSANNKAIMLKCLDYIDSFYSDVDVSEIKL